MAGATDCISDRAIDYACRSPPALGLDAKPKLREPPREIKGGRFLVAGIGVGVAFVHRAIDISVDAGRLNKDIS